MSLATRPLSSVATILRQQFGEPPQAARAFQEIYFAVPTLSQAKEAGVALGVS